ncbi:MAG TPA: M48 family metallopeptidase [Gemmatirosa sp.]
MIRLFRNLAIGGAACAAAATLAATGCVTASSVSQPQEVQMGQQYAAQINQQLPLVQDAEVNRYINVLGDSLAHVTPRSDLEWHFYIVDSPDINAFAVPGGYIYVNRGLIERAQNMSELAGPMGHEIGHVVLRHSIKQMAQQQNANMGASLICGFTRVCANGGGALIQLGGGALFAKFSRQDESEADHEGVIFTTKAGIDPRGIPDMFQILLDERKTRPDAVSAWFASHPLEEDRIRATREEIAQLVPPAQLETLTRDTRNFHAFQDRLRGLPHAPQRRTQ